MNKKQIKILILILSMIFTLTACTNEAGETESESGSSSVQGNQTLNVITLSFPGISEEIQSKIKDAMIEIYPNYGLNLTEFEFEDIDSYYSEIQVSLMSGQPYDLMYTERYLKVDKFIESDYLKDIYELIENDKSVNLDDYYTNALKAYEFDGKLYRMPINFFYNYLIGINTRASQKSIDKFKKLDRVSPNVMLDIFKQDTNIDNLAIISNMYHSELIEPSISTYINYENNTCDFNNDRFKNFLTDIKDSMFSTTGYQAYYDENQMAATSIINKDYDIVNSTKSMFNKRYSINMAQSLLEYTDPYFDHFIPMTNENDELIISSNLAYSIGNTANAKMAWDFLKFYINVYGENMIPFETTDDEIPIKKVFFINKANYFMRSLIAQSSGVTITWGDEIFGGGDESSYGGELIYDNDTTINRAIEKLEKYNEMPMIVIQKIDTDASIYYNVIRDFMKDLITVDQAAEQIQNAMSLYLSE